MQRYRPIGWKYESYRHSLAARGISTRHAFAEKKELVPLKIPEFVGPEGAFGGGVITPGSDVGMGAEFPEGAVKHMKHEEGKEKEILDTMVREPSPFNKEEYIEYYANNAGVLASLPKDIDKSDPIAVRAFIEDKRQADMAALLEKEKEGYYGRMTGEVVAPIDGMMRPTNFPRSGKTIPKLTAGVGSETPVLVTKEVFDRMPLREKDLYVKRMIEELGGDELESIKNSEHPGFEIRKLKSYNDYIEELFNKDAGNERIFDPLLKGKGIAEQRASNISGIEIGKLERGRFLYTGESELLRRQDEATKELNDILDRGGDVSPQTLYRIANIINPMAMQELRALDIRRVAKAEEMKVKNMLDDALNAGNISKEDYNERMFVIDTTAAELHKKTGKIIDEAIAAKYDTKRRLANIISTKREPGHQASIARSINAQVGILKNLPDSEFFKKSSELKNALKTEGIGSGFELLSQDTKKSLLSKIDGAEAYRRIIMSKRQMLERPSKRVTRGISLPILKAKVEAGEQVDYQDIVKLMRRLQRMGQ